MNAYRDAFLALLHRECPFTLTSGDERVQIIGPLSPKAIVLRGECAHYALDWALDVQRSSNHRLAELGKRVFRLCAGPQVGTSAERSDIQFEKTLTGIGTL